MNYVRLHFPSIVHAFSPTVVKAGMPTTKPNHLPSVQPLVLYGSWMPELSPSHIEGDKHMHPECLAYTEMLQLPPREIRIDYYSLFQYCLSWD